MCAMTVVIGSVLALLAIVALARWEAARKDERARRLGLVVDGHLVGEPDAEWALEDGDSGQPCGTSTSAKSGLAAVPEDRYHDAERGEREFVTVAEITRRIKKERALAAHRERRGVRRRETAAEQTVELAAAPAWPPSPHARGGRW